MLGGKYSIGDSVRLVSQSIATTIGTLGALGKYAVEHFRGEARAKDHFNTQVKSLVNRLVDVSHEPQRRRLEARNERRANADGARRLMLEIEGARRGIVAVFQALVDRSHKDDLGWAPIADPTVDGKNANRPTLVNQEKRSDLEPRYKLVCANASQIEQLPLQKLSPEQRVAVVKLREKIEKNLETLHKQARSVEKLKRQAPSDPTAALQGVGLELVRHKANELVGRELKALTAGLKPERNNDAWRLVYKFGELLKSRPDFRVALGMIDKDCGRGEIEKWVNGLPLSNESAVEGGKRPVEKLMDCFDQHIPTLQTLSIRGGQFVGSGAYGSVAPATFAGKNVVAKMSSVEDADASFGAGEVLMQGAFHENPHIPKVAGIIHKVDDNNKIDFRIVMDQVPGRKFAELIALGREQGRSGVPANIALNCFAGIAKAIELMHERGIVHADIKPDNVMLDENTLEPRLIDFGLAYQPDSNGPLLMRGTHHYMAPEMAQQNPHFGRQSPAIDIFAMGATLYELVGGTFPVHERLLGAGVERGRMSDIGVTVMTEPFWSEEAMRPIGDLIRSCWADDPADRPTTKQILQALKGENPVPVGEGEMGLKKANIAVLDVLKPGGRFRQDVIESTVGFLSPT